MRPIFDMALKPILRGLQQLLLRSGTLGHKTYCCEFLNFASSCRLLSVLAVLAVLASDLNRAERFRL